MTGSKFSIAASGWQELLFVEMCSSAVFTEKYLRPYGWSGSNFTAATNYANPKAEIQNDIIEIQIVEGQI